MSLRVAVIGAGVAGLTTAWELSKDGHRVEVFDSNSGIAESASFASSGCVGTASLVTWDLAGLPLANPGLTGWLNPPAWARSFNGLGWLRQRMRHQTPERQEFLFKAASDLASLNLLQIKSLSPHLWQEMETSQGVLLLLQSDSDTQSLQKGLQHLKSTDTKWLELDRAATQAIDPALNIEAGLQAAISIPSDFVMNGRQWLTLIKGELLRMGAKFHLHTQVSALTPEGTFITNQADNVRHKHRFDVVVCATGASTTLLESLGMILPLWKLDHCAISTPVREMLNTPSQVVMDVGKRVIISRTGLRLRASSGTPVMPGSHAQTVFRDLYKVLENWYPGAAQLHGSQALVQNWRATVTHTPDNLPLVGRSMHNKIWLNMGHGSRGWTFAAGASRLLADLISHRQPTIEPTPFSPLRNMLI